MGAHLAYHPVAAAMCANSARAGYARQGIVTLGEPKYIHIGAR